MRYDAVFAPGERYHVLGRGNHKQQIFFDERDYARFLCSALCLQFESVTPKLSRLVDCYVQTQGLDTSRISTAGRRLIRLIAFTQMPNHYHLFIEELVEGGISKYMQRVLGGYTKYHNTRYQTMGHLFQGPFKAVHQESNEQLLYTSAYMHRNPRELSEWFGREIEYPWSSYRDFVVNNRWGDLLDPAIILGQFNSHEAYRRFVESSGAKETKTVQTRGLDS